MPKRAKSKRPFFEKNDNNYKNDHIQTGVFFREYLVITCKPQAIIFLIALTLDEFEKVISLLDLLRKLTLHDVFILQILLIGNSSHPRGERGGS